MLHALLAATLCVSSPTLTAAPNPAPTLSATATELPYEEIAQTFLELHGLTDKAAEDIELNTILAEHFVSTRVGLFDVLVPTATLKEKAATKDYRDVCAALCSAQARWVEWLGASALEGEALQSSLEEHSKWIDQWSVRLLEAAGDAESRRAVDLFEADDEVRARTDHLASSMQSGAVLGLSLEATSPVRLVLMPERKGFVEFLAFTGWHNPDLRSIYWAPGIENWTEFRIQGLQVIALQYPNVAPAPGDYGAFTTMKDRDITGLEQQVVQMGMNQLFSYMHGEAMPNSVIRGLSINLLIDLYGTCHTRNDGDLRGRVTQGREEFVRGGQSEGGLLPPNVAENRWRSDYGKHRYTHILKQAQKSGASQDKRNKHKWNTFLLVADDDKERTIVHAPFFGPGAVEEERPGELFDMDYSEFLRAYNVAFMHYLQSAGGGSKKKSAVLFSSLMAKVSTSDAELSFGKVLEELYEMPLSNEKVDLNCLEGRFLKWISKQ